LWDKDEMTQIEPPANSFPSKIVGPSGEIVYWAPKGSRNPVCEDFKDIAKLKEMFKKAILHWVDIVCAVDREIYEKALSSDKWLDRLTKEALASDEAIPFVSISSIPLNERYFEDHYFVCYFTSDPFKMNDGSYVTVGVIGP
jgi:hypothetical protein